MLKEAISHEEAQASFRAKGIITVNIAEPVPLFCAGLCEVLTRDSTFRLAAFDSSAEAALRSALQYHPQVLLISMDVPPAGGLPMIRSLRRGGMEGHVVMYGKWHSHALILAAQHLGIVGMLSRNDPCAEFINAIQCAAAGETYRSRLVRDDLERIRRCDSSTHSVGELTATEHQVLTLLSGSRTSGEIADILCISARTVEKHRQNIGRKLNIRGSNALLSYALHHASVLHAAHE